MASSCNFITRIHEVHQAPQDSLVMYDMNGGIYYCKRANYKNFSRMFTRTVSERADITMDLCFAQSHSLVFDLDCKNSHHNPMTDDGLNVVLMSILSVLKILLIEKVHNFTMIVAMRAGSSGIHLHLPEFVVCNDDYIQLCAQLQPQFDRTIQLGDVSYEFCLDIPVNFSLVNSRKPGSKSQYEPVYVYYVEEHHTQFLDCRKHPLSLEFVRKKLKRNKCNSSSYFRKMLLFEELDLRYHLREFMMPVATPYNPLWKLSFETEIVQNTIEIVVGGSTCSSGEEEKGQVVAEFTFKQQPVPMIVRKSEKLLFRGTNWLKTYHYLNFNARLIETFMTNNHALKIWYERIRKSSSEVNDDGHPLFQPINELLKQDNFKFYNDPNPLKTVLEYDDGYYLLPTFYALTQHLKLRSSELVQNLRGMLDPKFCDLLDRIEKVPDKHVDLASKQFSVNTILFSGHNLYPRPTLMKDKLQLVFTEMKRQIFSASSAEGLVQVLRTVLERHFPIIVIQLAQSVKKPIRYMFNPLLDSWQEVAWQDVKHLVETICDKLKQFITSYPLESRGGLLEDHVLKNIHLSPLVSSVMSESNIQRLLVQMDSHKFLIRTLDGTMDLLVKHMGGVVPEHFASDRKLGVRLDRREMELLRDRKSPQEFRRLYESLVSKRFFYKYLKACFCDATDNLVDTLRELVHKDLNLGNLLVYQPRAESILRFYVHLCKYATFDYDTLMYLLDVLSSLFIATNYARKFFILKGVTKNGKSKLFQIISRVYGAYCSIIRPDNIRPNTSSLGPMPELASTLFSSRIVVFDEIGGKLNENLIKEITGNSTVSFRNMYEQNQGGVPSAKIFASTNTIPSCTTTTAFQDRVVAIPFEATFSERAPATTSEQLERNEYPIDTDESLVENCHEGFFLLTYLHFLDRLDMNDATVHYRPEPERLREFKEQYLANTNVYQRFKQHMDVQVVTTDSMTTMNELMSSVRHYLTITKTNDVQEEEIVEAFDREFRDHRRTDVVIPNTGGILGCSSSFNNKDFGASTSYDDAENEQLNLSDLDEDEETQEGTTIGTTSAAVDEPKKKKRKVEDDIKQNQPVIIYYQNVIIKNMKRVNINDM